MQKINNWDEIQAKGVSDYVSLHAGAYKCKIINALEYKSENGNQSLKVLVDIADGEFKDFYKKEYDANTNADRKWNNNAIKYLGLGETGLPFLKGFITVVENSNAGYKWDWDETKLIGKSVGCIFQREEYERQDGSVGLRTKLSQFRSIDKLSEFKNFRTKCLDGSLVDDEEYDKFENRKNKNNISSLENTAPDYVEVNVNDLPF